MSTDPREIELTDEQREMLAKRAEETGRPWAELLDELFAKLPRARRPKTGRTLFQALSEHGLIGTYDGPADLSTNPKHMDGFGEPHYGTDSD